MITITLKLNKSEAVMYGQLLDIAVKQSSEISKEDLVNQVFYELACLLYARHFGKVVLQDQSKEGTYSMPRAYALALMDVIHELTRMKKIPPPLADFAQKLFAFFDQKALKAS